MNKINNSANDVKKENKSLIICFTLNFLEKIGSNNKRRSCYYVK